MNIFVFLSFFIIAVILSEDNKNKKNALFLTSLTCVGFAIWAGFRNIYLWPDTLGYSITFERYTPQILNFFSTKQTILYDERGFFFFSSLIRTFTSESVVYFCIIAGLGFFFLYKGLEKYSIFPLLALAIYVSRFVFGRHFIQIRSGLSIAVLFWGLQYFTQKNWKKSFIVIALAYSLHHSAILAILLYLMNYLKIKKWHVVTMVLLSILVVGFFPSVIESNVQEASEDINMIRVYTDTSGSYYKNEKGLGLRNPMIYYQVAILFAYTLAENRLKNKVPSYYTIRNGYLMSTLLLILLSMFRILSGRTSTVFATFEILMVPPLVYLFNKKNRYVGYLGIAFIYTIVFYLNTN